MIWQIIGILAMATWCYLAYQALKPYFTETDERLKDWERRKRNEH